MTTYETNSECLNMSPKCYQNRTGCCDLRIESKEKDNLISELKQQVFELEQHEKDYDALNQRYKQLQNEFSLLSNAKLSLEYKLKQIDENYNRKINEMRGDNENSQMAYNEKTSINKKLFSHNDILGKQLELKESQIFDLNAKLSELNSHIERTDEEKAGLQKMIQGLNEFNGNQNTEINKLKEDQQKLSLICQEQDHTMKVGDQEKQQLQRQIDENNYNIQNLSGKLQAHSDNLNNLQIQLNNLKAINSKLENNIHDYEKQFDIFKEENNNLKNNLFGQKKARTDEEQKNEQLGNIINEKERQLNKLNQDYETLKMLLGRENEDKMANQMVNDKLRGHIYTLSKQNDNLIKEINKVIDEDDIMKKKINRKDRIMTLLRNNKVALDHTINSLDEIVCRNNQSGCLQHRTSSPRTYVRDDQ